MKLGLLFTDELRGFYKSKVMIFLWVGLPLIALLFRFISAGSSGQEIPFTLISSIVVSSIGGTLSAVMLTVFIINEKNRHVYDLFLIRPLKRRDIILAKFFSVYVCVAIASLIAVLVGMAADFATTGTLATTVLTDAGTIFGDQPLHDCGLMRRRRLDRRSFALGACRRDSGHLWRQPNFGNSLGADAA